MSQQQQQHLVRFRSAYAFQGDARAAQLSFNAGDIIIVDITRQGNGGWVWGNLFGSTRSGWCPQSYLILHQPTTSTTPAPAPAPAVRQAAAPYPAVHASTARTSVRRESPTTQATAAAATPASPPLRSHREPPIAVAYAVNNSTTTNNDPAASAFIWDDTTNTADIDDGFSGPIMGGVAKNGEPFRASAPPVMHQQRSSTRDEHNNRSNPFAKVGSGIRNAGKKSVHAVSNGAKKAGQFAKTTAQETKYRVQDMRSQQQQQHQQQHQQQPQKHHHLQQQGQHQQKPTKGQDIGNHAARGAVVGGTCGLVFGGVRGMKGGAVRGGVIGGAHGAVKGWKPFG